MEVHRLVDNQANAALEARRRREEAEERGVVPICFGIFKKHPNGHLDICCIKDLHKDFLYMLTFTTVVAGCLTLYATLV